MSVYGAPRVHSCHDPSIVPFVPAFEVGMIGTNEGPQARLDTTYFRNAAARRVESETLRGVL